MKNRKEKIKGSIKENLNLMSTPLMSILPGQIAFFCILSIIPIASIIIMIVSSLRIFKYDFVLNFVSNYIPYGTRIIKIILSNPEISTFDLLFIIMALYVASKATHSVIVASTRVYNGRQKDFFRTRIKAIIMLLVLIVLAVVLISVVGIGSRIVEYLNEVTGGSSFITNTYTILKWPFAFLMIFFTIKVVYTIAPNADVPSKSVTKGALLTTIVWIVSTYIFAVYVMKYASNSIFYGTASNLIVMVIWIYWLSYVFVFGMTFNEYRLTKKNNNSD